MSAEPIAIVGRGCAVPGALDPDTFWTNIAAGRCELAPGDGGGRVRGFDAVFDPHGFAIEPEDILRLDPLLRWVLHAGRQALTEAGRTGPLPGAGLVLGNLSYPTTGLVSVAEEVWRDGHPTADGRDRFSSGLPAHIAARALRLGRGGFALDAACASTLYAVSLAVDQLREGRAELMLAGAVSCSDRLLIKQGFSLLGASSPTGRSRPFHRDADGLVPGQGVVLVALMRLRDAITAAVPVLGVIRAVGLANDGRSGGLLAPAESGQERAMRLAYERAGLAPETVSLIECHATGTPVGDAVEARSTARVFAGCRDLPIGSVKSNVGHLLTAAGGAGLLKVLGALRAGIRPATLGADDPIDALNGTPLRLLAAPEEWPGPRRAGLSAFGFGGANAHLIVEAWEPGTRVAAGAPSDVPDDVVITGIGAKVADGADAADLRRAVLLGQRRTSARADIEIDLTDLRFPPKDLAIAQAQHVLLLEAAREAAAGLDLPRERTGVIVGMGVDPEVARYALTWRAGNGAAATGADVLGTMPNLVANRVNVQLDVAGPSFTVSAEEASGIVAIDLAIRALQRREIDVALVGAVDLSCEPVHRAALRSLGRDRPPGDAAVVLVLERAEDARRPALCHVDSMAESFVDLVVGDDGAQFDPASLFGVPHAAYGLLAVATAVIAVSHRAVPRAGGPAEPFSGGPVARAEVTTLDAAPRSVTVRSITPPSPWIAGRARRLHVYAGENRADVVAAIDAGRTSSHGVARLAMVVEDSDVPARLAAARRWLTDGGPRPDGIAYRDRPVGGEVAFVFTNGAAAYPGMGAELALAFPSLIGAFEKRATPWRAAAGTGVLERIWGAALLAGVHADITRDVLGLRPDAAIGYSSGESTALAALGAWPHPAPLLDDLRASDLFRDGLTGGFGVLRQAWRERGVPETGWASYLVGAPVEQVRAALAGAKAVHLMVVNAPRSCVIGGAESEAADVLARLGDVPVVPLDYPIAAHVPELAAVGPEYRRLHHRSTVDVLGLRFYSGATGEAYRADADRAADAILAQAVGTVDFVEVIERAYADGVRVFLEHGPQARCTGWIRQILDGREHVAVALDGGDGHAVGQLCQVVAELVAAGTTVRASALLDHLEAAVDQPTRPARTARLAAHPPELRLPARDEPTVLPRAPRLPDPPMRPAPGIPVPRPAGRPALAGVARAATVVPGVAEQFARVTAVHQEFLARQYEAHARFLETRQRVLVGLAAAPLPRRPDEDRPRFGRAELERLAAGEIPELFGPAFSALAGRRRRTSLPTPPMLLVDRVTAIDAVPASMGTGVIRTETDVTPDAWYLDATGRMPPGLMIEAGQADLLLIAWLGVDLCHAGDRVYRLLGCELTYHASPVPVGSTLRYEIHVDGHAEHGGVRLFFFHYDCYAGEKRVMTVRNGEAGFFTDEEIATGGGLHFDPASDPPDDPPPVAPVDLPDGRNFDADAVRAFAEGRPAECFGPKWTLTGAHVRSPRIDSGRLLLLDTVTDLDPAGGAWGRGYLRAETAVTPQDWFFAGHFVNDPCMPGTLMFQGGLQAMAFYLAALGYTVERDGWRFEPVPDAPTVLRCRGQVGPDSRRIEYEVLVRGLSLEPYPTLYADVLGTVDGVKAFHAQRAALRLVPDWPMPRQVPPAAGPAVTVAGVRQDYHALLACAWGPMVDALGPAYERFDRTGLRAPRLPGPPYHVMTRIVAVDGAFGGMRTGTSVTAEYDVPADAWYFADTPIMPFAVLMEVVLQPCGWLAMYLGSVLDADAPLLFRNLDGTGIVHREIGPDTGTLRTHVRCTDISRYGDMIIESFAVTCTTAGGETVFALDTVFGFFPPAAFAEQPGLPPAPAEVARLGQPGDRTVDLAGHFGQTALLMLDRITGYIPDGGSHGLGWLRAEKDVDADDWYFKAHFFQDPVQPGSLGVQAICSLLQWYLLQRGADAGLRVWPIRTGHRVTWKYRGQVVPTDGRVTVELDVTGHGTDAYGPYATADGWLWVDGRRIYQVTGLGMRLVPGP
jgi:acyl transferase domain-containing protein